MSPLERGEPRTGEIMMKRGGEAPFTRKARFMVALTVIATFSAAMFVVPLRGGASGSFTITGDVSTPSLKTNRPLPPSPPSRDLSSREGKGGGRKENGQPWRAVPVVLTPTNRSGRGLTADNPSVNATSTVPAASSSAGGIHEGTTDTMPGQAPTAAMGGPFGIGAEWQDAVSLVSEDGGSPSLRGDACMAPEKQEHVGEILRRRKGTPAGEKVAVCVRSKDAGRFLPEWIAYHYAIGVDEITLYDDNSIDQTKEILQPFVNAGLVMYLFKEVGRLEHEMQPLNHCLRKHIERREESSDAPVWVVFHDVDEYIFPVQTNSTMSEALMRHPETCCVQVPRVQYGTSGYQQQPRGLLLELFLRHADPAIFTDNRFPKVAVNLDPTDPSLGSIKPPLFNMHDAEGCTCELIDVTDMRINHYLGSTEDYLAKTRRFWEVWIRIPATIQKSYSRDQVEENLKRRDINVQASDTITNWACATREILYRVVNGIDLEKGSEETY